MARKSYSDKEREQVKEALLITVLESIVNQGLVHSSIAILCEKVGFAVLSIEEEQQVYRCLSNENFQAFRNDQLYLYRNLLTIFGVPMDNIDPRLFGNLSLTMMMSYKAIPDTMPFLFPEVADDMVEFQINALLDEMQRAKKEAIR